VRRAPNLRLDPFRLPNPGDGIVYRDNDGQFAIPYHGVTLQVIASDGLGWDHVSVSLRHRCPTWAEMEYIRELFFRDDETVMQLSVPRRDHISLHPYCLHLWRPNDGREIPRPSAELVGAGVAALRTAGEGR
jgi:hypothetical protein